MIKKTVTKRQTGVPAIIVASDPSVWGSCRIITPNLEQAYRDVFGKNSNYFFLNEMTTPSEVWDLANAIHASRPERIIFIDHSPHPIALLMGLETLYGKHALPPLYFHVYGDFTLYTPFWAKVELILKKTRVHFVCASDRQEKLIRLFLRGPDGAVSKCHFPVDVKRYQASTELRRQWRERLGLKQDELAILYAGRISLQKNVIRLTEEVARFTASLGVGLRFFIAGTFDDMAAPFFGVHTLRGYYQQAWMRALAATKREIRDRVSFLGHFGADELRGVYNAADIYASLSLHHDEDFGMAPAESLCTGTPVLLTDWGGYSSFEETGNDSDVRLVPVTVGNYGLCISTPAFQRALFQLSALDQSEAARAARAGRFQRRFSIEAAAKIIKTLHAGRPPVFQGFHWRMQKHAEVILTAIPFSQGPRKDTFYEEIYNAYVNTK